MPELFIELFSEEIPARMQARAGEELARLIGDALAPLKPEATRAFVGPRRVALVATVAAGVAESRSSERGPRTSAPEQALAGFLRKHGAAQEDLRAEGDFWVLDKVVPGASAADLIAAALPPLLRRFAWPKSMRWGGTSGFTWVRPLRRIICQLDGAVVPFTLADGDDDGHGLASSDTTEGHRFLSPGPVQVRGCADWREKLAARHVMVDAADRRAAIDAGLKDLAARHGLALVEDPGLLDEVAGLVEWPSLHLGRIDAAYMDLPAEVMQVSMRVNQRYFAFRDALGNAAPFFAFAANINPSDPAPMIGGNERVLRARFADARHFWDLDRKTKLADRVAALDNVTFHAKLGSQGDRVRRIEALATRIAPHFKADPADAALAASLAKADLTTGMVGEFPELQGIMGGYYAAHDGHSAAISDAVRRHYDPKGPGDAVPDRPVAMTVAVADKLDQLIGFFSVGEKPTGSGDPFALRRAALGVIRIIRDQSIRFNLQNLIALHAEELIRGIGSRTFSEYLNEQEELERRHGAEPNPRPMRASTVPFYGKVAEDVLAFILDRLVVQLRTDGARHDVLRAVLGSGADDDLVRLLARTDAVAAMLGSEDGANLLAGYKRAANILRIEEKKDGPHDRAVDAALLDLDEERALATTLEKVASETDRHLSGENYGAAMAIFATLRPVLDDFFNKVTVNDSRPEVRLNRLGLLAQVRAVMNRVADFSRIEG